jgi:hypothetical protein
MKRWERTNLNYLVRVKLTKRGLDELRRQHDELRKTNRSLHEFREPVTDKDGYSTHQFWVIMRDLGHLLKWEMDPPFKPGIMVEIEP